jgi:Lysophospholipase
MNENTAEKRASKPFSSFPIGYYQLHPDVSINFQLNRFYNWAGDAQMLEEMRTVAPGITSYAVFTQTFLDLAEQALSQGQTLKGAYYLRTAEFFLAPTDARKQSIRQRFVQLVLGYYKVTPAVSSRIPYESGWLSAYRFTPEQPKGILVVFGGFDSYIEEWLSAAFACYDAGYDLILFEGPGQGSVLEDAHLPMTMEWEKPVKAVLDFYHLDDVTLMGFSLGGGLAIHAAAFEQRVRRVIAYDILSDFLAVNLRPFSDAVRQQVLACLESGNADTLNALMAQLAKQSLLAEWGIQQGLHITGCQTPYELFHLYQQFRTATISANVTQDVLLLCGAEDHYVPVSQFYDQIATLQNARSLTARLFTRAEQAQNHCQVGNYGLALRTIVEWIDGLRTRDQDLAAQR